MVCSVLLPIVLTRLHHMSNCSDAAPWPHGLHTTITHKHTHHGLCLWGEEEVGDAYTCVAAGHGRCRHLMIHLSGLRPHAHTYTRPGPPARYPSPLTERNSSFSARTGRLARIQTARRSCGPRMRPARHLTASHVSGSVPYRSEERMEWDFACMAFAEALCFHGRGGSRRF